MTDRTISEAAEPPTVKARLIGREDSSVFGPDSREELRWIGKPWRRVELMTHRYFHKGEEHDRSRDLTLHLGFRRLGLGLTIIVTRASYLDYSEERQ